MKKKIYYCPANRWDCPYFARNGRCMMDEDQDPWEECDDFATFWDHDDEYWIEEEVSES